MALNRIKAESGIQLLARLTKKPGIEKFYPVIFGDGPNHNEFIELYSQISTNTLMVELLCEALIPRALRGPEAGVIIFNTDGNLDFNCILNLLRNKIINRINNTDDISEHTIPDVEVLLKSVLKNLYVLEIFDATEFYITIQNLENLLAKRPISLVVFHTLTAFYWSEQDFKITKMDTYIKKLLNIIQRVTKDHKVTVLYSRPEYFNSSKEPNDNLEQHLTDKQINYQIQVIHNTSGINFVKVKTYNSQVEKMFNLKNGEIVWS